MTRTLRIAISASALIAIVMANGTPARSYALSSSKWPNGTTVVMQLQLGSGSGTLIDGSTSWNQVATNSLATWNTYIDLVKFSAVNNSTARDGQNNGINNVTFNSTLYGDAFDDGVLAITQSWISGVDRTKKVETDVVFNTKYGWNSYRGNLRSNVEDFQRVALHEFGHALGLSHPDQNGQNVTALMNAFISNLDSLQADDISGGRALYGAGVTSNVNFPPRNETNDFYSQLEGLYQNVLRAASVASFVNAEGANLWLTEYARYRVGRCAHSDAVARVFSQIENTGVFGVCALTPAGAIPFPPRNEGLDFMNQLEAEYRDKLRSSASTAFVNNEGRVVWILEYLRYRLNGCGHGDAVTRVFQQILGQGIQPVCR